MRSNYEHVVYWYSSSSSSHTPCRRPRRTPTTPAVVSTLSFLTSRSSPPPLTRSPDVLHYPAGGAITALPLAAHEPPLPLGRPPPPDIPLSLENIGELQSSNPNPNNLCPTVARLDHCQWRVRHRAAPPASHPSRAPATLP